ncbi:alpha/beta fold hydrolase [Nocardia mexicana]|uniref:Pimeloyl-ACP methyl ester carboxylesterase n=1 Tax=Nocardia mexicana TaxID=279262 RepID=A0A370GHH8_9NOCA|nr:alpha/beta hydrolase [Nocardia mexicana]RDI43258.1 pimeloyl-ACP methyl ester carboxylesterase [Nocardia mexicana]
MPYVTSAGAKVHFTDTGGDGPAVVLGHGFFLDQEMFAAQAAALAPRYRVISIDARGHGLTEDAGEPFSYWDLARDAWAVVDELGIERAVVGGMSQGGFIALRMALLCPGRVDGLILIGTSADAYSPKQKVGYREIMDTWMSAAPLAPIAKTMASVMIGGTTDDKKPWLDKWFASDRGRIRLAADCLIDRESITEMIGRIDCPATLVQGVGDQAFSHEEMVALADQLGGPARLHTIAGATHAVNITHPREVNEILSGFLSEIY